MTQYNQAEKIDNLSLLKFSGEDSMSFLQGQLTNDINALGKNWQFSGYCSPKGRLLAVLQLWKDNDAVYGLVDSSVCDAIVKRLRMYVLRSKVTIDVLQSSVCVGALDSDDNQRFSLSLMANIHRLNYGSRQLVVYLDGESDLVDDFIVDDSTLQAGAANNWANANINEGLPTINADTSEVFVPQMVNLELLGGVNFKKGCYTGQEIVARMHYLGKLKQRMYVCEINASANAGDKVMAGDKNAGTIVSAANGSNGKETRSALAVLRTELLEQTPVLTLENGGELKPRSKQPYTIP